MSCDRFRELAWLAVDEELPADERRDLDLHLAGCAECRATVEAARRVRRGVQELHRAAPPAAPAHFKEATLARIERSTSAPKSPPGTSSTRERAEAAAPAPLSPRLSLLRSRLPLAAAALLLIAIGVWQWQHGGTARPEEEKVALAPKSHRELDSSGAEGSFESSGKEAAGEESPPAPGAKPDLEAAKLEEESDRREGVPTDALERTKSDFDDETARDDESRRNLGDAKEREAPARPPASTPPPEPPLPPILVEVRAAATARDALARLDAGLDESESRLRQAAESRKRGAPGAARGEGGEKKSQDAKDLDAVKKSEGAASPEGAARNEKQVRFAAAEAEEAEAPALLFFFLPIEPAELAAWLRPRVERGEAAASERLAVVDLKQTELDEFVASLARQKTPAQPLAAGEWLEHASASWAEKERAKDSRGLVGGPPTGGGGARAPERRAEDRLDEDKSRHGDEHKADGRVGGKAKEATKAPARARAVFWFGGGDLLRVKSGR